MNKPPQLALIAGLLLLAISAARAEDFAVPSSISFRRLQLLERPARDHKDGQMKVYVQIKGEELGGKLLVSSADHLARITVGNLQQMLLDKVKGTGRFDVYNMDSTGVMDQSSIVVEGRVVRATQHIENLIVARKAITRVGFSVNIIETDTGKVLRARTFTGAYGDQPGKGTVVTSDSELRSPTMQDSLYKDYDHAMQDALEDVAVYLESRYRPVGRITEVLGDSVAIDGGEIHGFDGGDEVVVFRTKFSVQNGERVPGIMIGLARAACPTVGERTSTCRIAKKAAGATVQVGDWVVLADALRKN